MSNPDCSLCSKEAVDAIGIDAGNNAEVGIIVNLCEEHFKEQEEMGYEFEEKYAERFNEMANTRMSGGIL